MLALGILLDETIEGSLGETGHLAFAEGEQEDDAAPPPLFWNGRKWVRSVLDIPEEKMKTVDAYQEESGSEISLNSNRSSESEELDEHEEPTEYTRHEPKATKHMQKRRFKKNPATWQETQARIKAVEEALRIEREKKRKAEELARKGFDHHYSSRGASPSKRKKVQPSQRRPNQQGESDENESSSESNSRKEAQDVSDGSPSMSLPIRGQSARPRAEQMLSKAFTAIETSSDSEASRARSEETSDGASGSTSEDEDHASVQPQSDDDDEDMELRS
jgi:hypothetical protein